MTSLGRWLRRDLSHLGFTHTHTTAPAHTHRQGYQSGSLRVNDMSHSVSQCLTVCHSVSPEMEAVLLSGWAEPVAAGSGGGVDKPQCEEGLHVTSSAWTQTCVSRGRKESKKKGRKELGKEGRKEREKERRKAERNEGRNEGKREE